MALNSPITVPMAEFSAMVRLLRISRWAVAGAGIPWVGCRQFLHIGQSIPIDVRIVVIFYSISILSHHIGDGYGKVLVEGGVVIIRSTNRECIILVIGLVIERLICSKSAILIHIEMIKR